MTSRPAVVQHHYPRDFVHCYGCGRENEQGLRIESTPEGDDVVALFRPGEHHVAVPGFVYGGLLASLVDCHAMATASAFSERQAGRQVGEAEAPRYVTASLHVEYRKPTPLGPELEVRGRVREHSDRKSVVEVTVAVDGGVTVRGEVVAVPMPRSMMRA